MRDRISATRVANVMNKQLMIWKDTENAEQIITDCCHAFATALDLDHRQRQNFMRQCALSDIQKGSE
jgi:hypothetical protein